MKHTVLVLLLTWGVLGAPVWAAPDAEPTRPTTARDFYNQGTRNLQDGKWRDAEVSLQTAVASNDDAVQPVALYNLGHARFKQGVEALKKAADAPAAKTRGETSVTAGEAAIRAADDALSGYDLNAIIAAYLNGRGARKQMKAASEAVKSALETHGLVLGRWQRASGDFKSAHELRVRYTDAQFNAAVVDRHIAELVDRLQALQFCMQGLSGRRQELRQRMAQLRKLLPEGLKQQCAGDEEDDEDEEPQPQEPKEGQEEAKQREGREMKMTPEEAARFLEGLKLDSNRKLPMGAERSERPTDRTGRDW